MEARFEDLEVKAAFLEHRLAELEVVVREQADALERMGREVAALREVAGWGAERGGLAEEVPPHHERL